MCGIFGYAGKNNNAAEVIFTGLKRLDYRGYDSWGITVNANGRLKTAKQTGIITLNQQIKNLPKSAVGIGHTRWATHGGVTKTNAHPHYSTDKSFALAHNGIVENYQQLQKQLIKKNFKFITQTDTEVIARLIEDQRKRSSDLVTAVRKAFLKLKGRNTIILLTKTGEIIAVRNGSPLVVGLADKTGEIYLSSDTLSFAPLVQKMIVVDNGQLVRYHQKNMEMFDVKKGKKISYEAEKINLKGGKINKEGFDHYMIKEIHDSPYVISQVINQEEKGYRELVKAIKKANKVYTIGSGTAGLAADQIAYYLRIHGKIATTSLIGAEAQSYNHLFSRDDLIIAPSQSGETADVLEILEIAKQKGTKIASYVNMVGSAMTRMSDYPFMAQAGPEICVMSTKIFTSQIAWGYLVAKTLARKFKQGKGELEKTSQAIQRYLDNKNNHTALKRLAQKLVKAKDIFLIGKSQNLSIVMEGMIKIIEGSYKHAHAITAGNLKHYAITIMEKGVPVIAVVSNDAVKSDVINAINEIKTRKATVIGIAPEEHDSFDYYLKVPDMGETSAILNIIPLQLLSYYMSVKLGNSVDKPRNIAKSVTVK
jgi:glucosamine--fructose-6-phosphate aminotransferase (isomerizing)